MEKAMTSMRAIVGLPLIVAASVVGIVTFGAAQASASGAPVVIPYAKMCNELAGHCERTANGDRLASSRAIRSTKA